MSQRKSSPLLTCILIAIFLATSSVLASPALPLPEQAGTEITPLSDLRATVPLAFTSWQVESYGSPDRLLPADPNAPATVNFFLSRYAGYGGCNWFLGAYTVNDSDLFIRTPSQTRIFCPDNPQEGLFLASLLNTIEYELVDGKLIGYTTNRQQLITLVPAQTQPLEGTVWNLAFMAIPGRDPVPLVMSTSITAQFSDDEISGSTDCSTFNTSFVSGPNLFPVDQFVSATADVGEMTIVAGDVQCDAPNGVLEQEQRFALLFQSVSSYGVLGGTLVMFDAEGQPLLMYGAGGQAGSDG